MIILWNSAAMEVAMTLVNGEQRYEYRWEANRTLARDMLKFLRDSLAEHDASFADVSGIGVFKGPGSFTGLRIGMTVLNTFARTQHVPIVGVMGEAWQSKALTRLEAGETDEIVLPEYGGEAHITAPRK